MQKEEEHVNLKQSPMRYLRRMPKTITVALCITFTTLFFCSTLTVDVVKNKSSDNVTDKFQIDRTLVSYAYFEKDSIQKQNFDFFLKRGLGIGQDESSNLPPYTDFSLVITGELCTPCVSLVPHVARVKAEVWEVDGAWAGERITVLHRLRNVGMDIAAHNATLGWLMQRQKLHAYKYFVFLNSSVRGPFYPSYMPRGWHWTFAFTQRLTKVVKIVGSSLVCLPKKDPGGYGPKIESWAFALDNVAVSLLMEKGTFDTRTCKVCHGESGIVVMGEYGMSRALLDAGYNLNTLMSRYSRQTDWRDEGNWNCNDNVHPSRHGTYDGVSMHPFETVFVKSTWYVGEPHLSRYTAWFMEHSNGKLGTQGSFDEDLYYYAMCLEGRYPENTKTIFKPKNLTCTGS